MANPFEDVLNEYAAKVVERAQSNLRIKRRVRGKVVNRVASGHLEKSLTYKLRFRYRKPTLDFTVSNSEAGQYADVIEWGRRAGAKMPPPKAIENWIKIKRLKLRNRQGEFIKSTESNIKSAAFAMAKSIGENGIVGIGYYKEAIEDTWDEYKDVLTEAFVKGFETRKLLNKR
ncbi:MAG: hypothetical protein ACK528_10380 [Alphaproteobacteria bacterium]|jgi:hypothetical protein